MSPQVTTRFASFPVNKTSDIALANSSVGRSIKPEVQDRSLEDKTRGEAIFEGPEAK
jgi:hypothetical protein